MLRYLFSFIVISLFLISCKSDIEQSYCGEFEYDKNGLIVIEGEILDSTYSFLFDTGCTNTFISSKRYVSDNNRDVCFLLFDTLFTHSIIQNTTVEFGSHSVAMKDIEVNHSDMIPSIIGNDIIQKHYWLFDTEEMTYTISNQPILDSLDLYLPINYDLINGTMCYSTSSEVLLIDTGRSLFLYNDEIKHYVDLEIVRSGFWYSFLDNSGFPKTANIINYKKLTIGNIELSDAVIYNNTHKFEDSRADKLWFDAILTIDAFKKYKYLYIDPNKQILYLK